MEPIDRQERRQDRRDAAVRRDQRQPQSDTLIDRLTSDAALDAFREAWEQADAEGDKGNRVRRGMVAAVDTVFDPHHGTRCQDNADRLEDSGLWKCRVCGAVVTR